VTLLDPAKQELELSEGPGAGTIGSEDKTVGEDDTAGAFVGTTTGAFVVTTAGARELFTDGAIVGPIDGAKVFGAVGAFVGLLGCVVGAADGAGVEE